MTTNTQVVEETKRFGISSNLSVLKYLELASVMINKFLALFAGCSLLIMVALIVGNGLLRVVYKPFSGTTEVVGWLCALSIAFGLGYTQMHKGYVDIDALVIQFPHKAQHVLKIGILTVSTSFFALVSWQVVVYGMKVGQNGNLSETLGITFFPLIIMVALGFASLTLALLIDLFKQLFPGRCSHG